MNDTEIIDWMQSHLTFFREVVPNVARPFNMGWLDDHGVERVTAGIDLRDCVRGAIVEKQSNGGAHLRVARQRHESGGATG